MALSFLGVNLHGHFYATKYTVPHLLRVGGGAIVNTASVLAEATLPGGVAYSTSKAALIGFTKALAHDLGPARMRVNCLLPGSTDTPMMWQDVTAEARAAVEAEVAANQPLRRVAPSRGDRAGGAVPGERCGFVRDGGGRGRRRRPPGSDRDDAVRPGMPITGTPDGRGRHRPSGETA